MGVHFAIVIILYISVLGVQNALKPVSQEVNTKILNNNRTEIYKPANTPLPIKHLTSIKSINKTKYNQINNNAEDKETLENIGGKSTYANKSKRLIKRNGPRKKKSEFNDDPDPEYQYNEDKNKRNIAIDGAIDKSLPVFDSAKEDEYTFKPVRRKTDSNHNVETELYEGIDNEQTEFSIPTPTYSHINGNDEKQSATASTTFVAERNEKSETKELTYDDNLDDSLSDMTYTGKMELKNMKTKYDDDKKIPAIFTIPPTNDADSLIVPTRYTSTYYDIIPIRKEIAEESTQVNHKSESSTETVLVHFTVPTLTSPADDNTKSLLDSSNSEKPQTISDHLDFGLDKTEDETKKVIGVDDTQTEQNDDIKSTEIIVETDKQPNSSEDGGDITPKTFKLNVVETNYYYDDDNDNKDYDNTSNAVTTLSVEKTYYKENNIDKYRTTTPTIITKHIHRKHKGKEYHKQPFNLHPFSNKVHAQKLIEEDENVYETFDDGFKHKFSDISVPSLEKKLEKYIKTPPTHNYYNTTPSIHITYTNKKSIIAKNGHTGHKSKIPSVRKDHINRHKNNRYTTKGTTLPVGKINQGTKLGSKSQFQTTFNSSDAAQENSTVSILRNIHDITPYAVQSSTQKLTVNKLNSTLKLKAVMNKLLSWKLPNHTFSTSNNHNEVAADYQTTFYVEAVTAPHTKKITIITPWYKIKENDKISHYNVLPLKIQTKIETSSKPYEHYNNDNEKSGTLPYRLRATKSNSISTTTSTLMPLNKSSQDLRKLDNITAYKAKIQKITTSKGILLQTKVTHGLKVNDGDENDLVSVTKQISKAKAITNVLSKNSENTFTPDEAKVKCITSNSTMKVSIGNITTQSMTDKILNKLLKIVPITEKKVPFSTEDRNKYLNKTSSLYRTIVQITLKELLDKSLNKSCKKTADDEDSRNFRDFKDDDNLTDLIFSETFLKGVFSPPNLYKSADKTTLPPKDSYLNSNLGENANIESVSDTDKTSLFDNEPVFSDPEMYEYKSKAKTLVENILNIILNDALSGSSDKIKRKQLRNVSEYKHDVVNRVLKELNNKTKERVLYIKKSQSSETALSTDIFNVTKNTVVPSSTANVAKLYTVTFEEVLPLAVDYAQTSTSNTVTTSSLNDQDTQVTTESNLFYKHTPSIDDKETTETIGNDKNDTYDSVYTTDIVKSTIIITNEELIRRSQSNRLKTNKYFITTTEINDSTNTEINYSNREISSTDQTVFSTDKLKTSKVTENREYTTSVTDSGKNEIENNINKFDKNSWFIQNDYGNLTHRDTSSFSTYTIPFSSTTSVSDKTLKFNPMIYDSYSGTVNQGVTKYNKKNYDEHEDSTSTAKLTLPLIHLTSDEANQEVTEKITYLVNIEEVSNKTYKHNDSYTSQTGELSTIALNSLSGGYNVKKERKNDIKLQKNLTTVLVTDRQHQRFISEDQLNKPDIMFQDKTVTSSFSDMSSSADLTKESISTNDPINFPQIELSTHISHTSKYFYPELESSQQEILKDAKVMPTKYNKTTSMDNSWKFGNIVKPPSKSLEEVKVEGYTEVTHKIKNADNLNSAAYISSQDLNKDLEKIAVALKSYVNDLSAMIGPKTEITPFMQDKTLIDVNPEEISEMLYYDLPDSKGNEAVSLTFRPVSNKSSLLTGEILNALLKEFIVMNDVAEKKQSVENIKVPIKLNPFDPNLESVIRKLLLNNKIPGLVPKHPEKVAIFEVEGKDSDEIENNLYPKKVSVYDPDEDKILQNIKLYYTSPHKKQSKATTQKPIKVQWHEIKNPDGRKSNKQNCPKIHCFLVNDSTDKSKSKIGIIDKIQEIRPIISTSNSVENLPIDMDSRKSLNSIKLPVKKPVIKLPEYAKNNSITIKNKTILPTYIPTKSFFYKKPEAVELFTNDLHANSSVVKMKISDSIDVPSSDMCGLENAHLRRVQEGISNIEKYPWLGVLMYPKGKRHLVTTVVLVTVQLVITSAWEISKLPKDDFRRCSKVILGHNCSGPLIGVLNYNYHPDFRAGFLSSLAVVQIDSDNYVHILRPICPPPRQLFSPNFYSMVMPEDCTSSKITIYKMDHVPMDLCRGYYRQHKVVTSRYWPRHSACGKSRWGGGCLWRSGTVLVVKQDQRWHLLGFGVPGPGCEAPSRYIDYAMHANWIDLMLQRIGQSAVTRMAPNRLIYRRCVNQIQRFGPCDAEEVSKSLFRDTSEYIEPRSKRRGRQVSRRQYNLTIWENINYHCVVFQAYNLKDTSEHPQPKLEIKRNAPNEDGGDGRGEEDGRDRGDVRDGGNHPASIEFNVTIDFYDGVIYKVLAFGERSKRTDLIQVSKLIEDNILKTLTEHAGNYITKTTQDYDVKKNTWQPFLDANRRYIRRKSLEKFKNTYSSLHNKMARPRRKTMEQPSRRKAKSRMNTRKKENSEKKRIKTSKHEKIRK